MKNIHLIPTDKPSRLHKIGNKLGLTDKPNSNFLAKQQNIYITSDEEIKEGDWYYNERLNQVFQAIRKSGYNTVDREYKIILTTDPHLIKDGVQAIDDEFLEWFVKNPSCEEISIEWLGTYTYGIVGYKIIIPKEETTAYHYLSCCRSIEECHCGKYPKQELERGITITHVGKQETIEEEEVRKYAELSYYNGDEVNAFVNGAKWMQDKNKNKYSEEDMLDFAWYLIKNVGQYSDDRIAHFEGKYLEQFKKK